MNRLTGLTYLFNKNTKLIILGTFPSVKSRNICYYNHPHNAFWKIIADTFNQSVSLSTIQERYHCLLSHNIGLWDVIKSCEISGSADSSIIQPEFNDFNILRQNCPHLKYIVFNSRNAQKFFKRYLKGLPNESPLKKWLNTRISSVPLPSTSPANARLAFAEKETIWQKAFCEYLNITY